MEATQMFRADETVGAAPILFRPLGRLTPSCPQRSRLRSRLCGRARIRRVMPGQVLIAEGSEPALCGVVLSGALRICKLREDGALHVLGLLFAGDLFGAPIGGLRAAGVEAATEARVACLDRRSLASLLESDRELERDFLLAALSEVDAAYELVLLLGIPNRQARMAAFLLALVERGVGWRGPRGRTILDLPVPRRDVAAYLGVAIETVSRSLHALEHAGAIRLVEANSIEIMDECLLRRLAGEAREAAAFDRGSAA
jgi:CRP/FNR family transcriptional regulator, anaerobic regulatory protein